MLSSDVACWWDLGVWQCPVLFPASLPHPLFWNVETTDVLGVVPRRLMERGLKVVHPPNRCPMTMEHPSSSASDDVGTQDLGETPRRPS